MDILTWVSAQKDVTTFTIDGAIDNVGGLDTKRYLAYRFYGKACDFMPRFVEYPIEIYLSGNLIAISILKFFTFIIFFLFILCAGIYIINRNKIGRKHV